MSGSKKNPEPAEPASISEAVEATEARVSAQEMAAVAEAEASAAAARMEAARAAADAAMEEQYQNTAKNLTIDESAEAFTDKRSGDVIFRRELGEPEFWLDKKDRVPPRPVLTEDQEREISQRVEIPADQTPKYEPRHILSKEFGGASNYEVGLDSVRRDAERRLERLRDGGAGQDLIRAAREDLRKLDCMYENYHIGMNVFRTAKGGRDKVKK